jgi:hypothetical protein
MSSSRVGREQRWNALFVPRFGVHILARRFQWRTGSFVLELSPRHHTRVDYMSFEVCGDAPSVNGLGHPRHPALGLPHCYNL